MNSNYIFGENEPDQELRRLRRIESALDADTQALLARTEIASGWSCLEVGAGGGSILRWLGERVGASGQAVGVDKNARYLKTFDGPPYEIVGADIRDLQCPGTFDVIHARYVLIHNRDATEIIDHLRTLLEPGGHLVLEEPDFESAEWIDDGTHARAGERVNRAICSMFKGLSLDPGYGKRLPLALSRLGLACTHVEARAHLEAGGEPVALVMADSAEALREKYVATGEASAEDVASYSRGGRDPSAWAIFYSTVAVIAQKRR